jgi:hypothetical protein
VHGSLGARRYLCCPRYLCPTRQPTDRPMIACDRAGIAM